MGERSGHLVCKVRPHQRCADSVGFGLCLLYRIDGKTPQSAKVVGFRAEVTDMSTLLAGFTDFNVHFWTSETVKLSPSTQAGLTLIILNILRNASDVVVVPAPDEPVTAMIGCFLT